MNTTLEELEQSIERWLEGESFESLADDDASW